MARRNRNPQVDIRTGAPEYQWGKDDPPLGGEGYAHPEFTILRNLRAVFSVGRPPGASQEVHGRGV